MPAARPAVESAAAAVASAPAAETIVKPEKPLVSPPVVQARPQGRGQPETFAPVAKPHRPSPSAPHTAAPTTRATQSVTQAAPSSPQPAAVTAPSQAPEPAASAMPRPNGRVEALRAALAACKDKGNFFGQQLCIQEMRWKYCGAPLSVDPLWGKVAECPNSTQQSNNP